MVSCLTDRSSFSLSILHLISSLFQSSQQDLFTKLKRMPINFLPLFRYKSNKTTNLIKHVKLKKKVLLLAHKNYKTNGYYVYA